MADNDGSGKIGQLNGKWSILFRAMLAIGAITLPSLVALQVWEVQQIYDLKQAQAVSDNRITAFINLGPRYTPKDARADRLELKTEIFKEVKAHYPPDWLTKEVESLTRRIEALEKR